MMTLCLVIVFMSILATVTHASFCSSISCTCSNECSDKCNGSYWYYGNGICSAYCCPLPSLMHCQYDGRVCADNDSSDGFPKTDCLVATCNAECDQNTDCKCPESECVGNDYYDYQSVCNESCECECESKISYDDSRCVVSYIELNKIIEPGELTCQNASVTLYIKGVGAGIVGTNINVIDFLPPSVNLESDLSSGCSYENETRKITCSIDSITANETRTVSFGVSINQLGHVLVDVYPDSGINYTNYLGNETFTSFPETYVNVSGYSGAEEICNDTIDNNCNGFVDLNDSDCYQCVDNDNDTYYNYSSTCQIGNDCNDSNPSINPSAVEICNDGVDNNCNDKIDCDDSACSGNQACIPSSPSGGGGGSFIGGGGYAIVTGVVCGNNKCEYGETCSKCPKDCLKNGQVCCDNITYNGSCCVDADCGNGYECNITKMCNPVSVTENATQPITSGCEESWICIDWSLCENDVQTRRCVDKNGCGTSFSEPEEVRKCTSATNITGLFSLLDSPNLLVFIASLIILLLLFLWKRRKEKN